MVSDYFYYVLWLLAHTVVALITQTRDVYLLVYNRLLRGDKLPQLRKLPQHLTVLLPSSPPTSPASTNSKHLDILVNLVLWSLATNIQYVSFYDPLGLLVKWEDELMKRIQSRMNKSQRLIWHGANTTGKNGFAGPKVHVKILSAGRASLVDACRQLSHTEQVLTVPIISKHLLTNYEFPDPQLAIYFGEYLNLCGYPPWQIRLTEFIHAGRHLHAFDEREFFSVLQCYSKCQQRVGK
ncbi:dehydrodolichyl diphosphate synthase complex subunit nus1-like [Atheta coriaria]|uniref:dehydrodolichyl diphosphate synthase complex subunit nus1-like n=1 Tax=Dalotia coriaria TaxID=877792 RepID=UPI0031F3ADE8